MISITEIGALTAHPERVLGTHFYQPPFLVPLVEVVRTEIDRSAPMDRRLQSLRIAGKVPIYVRKDVPGFVANRMQHALWREAFALIDEGFAMRRPSISRYRTALVCGCRCWVRWQTLIW